MARASQVLQHINDNASRKDHAHLKGLLQEISDALALFDANDRVMLKNTRFSALPIAFHQALNALLNSDFKRKKRVNLLGYKVKFIAFDDATGVLVESAYNGVQGSEFTLKHITDLMRTSDDIYHAVATAIQESLGWKWVAVTRFVDTERLEVLSFLEEYEQLENFEYDIPGTPCKSVIDTNEFTIFKNLKDAFPNYKALQDLGAKTYAGLIFKGADGLPVGHVMAMHDNAEVNFAQAEHVIDVATLTLSAHFQLCCANDRLKAVQKQANQDKLSKIGNRLAFDTALEKLANDAKRRNTDDFTLAIIDLDKLKPLNDTLGHKAGDRFIKFMAGELKHLGRQSDQAFRIGGDEFAILFSQNASPFIDSIKARFERALVRISDKLNFPIGASIGFASLSEANGNLERWTEIADERMYRQKASKRTNL